MSTGKIFDILEFISESARNDFLSEVEIRHLKAGQILYARGDRDAGLFRIIRGEVRLSVSRTDGRELYYVMMGPGDCFGESNFVDGRERPQTAEARSAVEIQVLPEAGIERMLRNHASFNSALLKLLARHMRLLIDLLADASLNDLPERIARRILDAMPSGEGASQGGQPVNLSQTELAHMVGASRQSVNKVLQQFQQEQLITTEYGGLVVQARDRLRMRAEAGRLSPF